MDLIRILYDPREVDIHAEYALECFSQWPLTAEQIRTKRFVRFSL